MEKILLNRIQCNRCGDVIVSLHRHDLKWCKCGDVAVDGGTDYLRRLTSGPSAGFIERSKYEDVPCD